MACTKTTFCASCAYKLFSMMEHLHFSIPNNILNKPHKPYNVFNIKMKTKLKIKFLLLFLIIIERGERD
jgi:hypothetical protein